MLSSSHIPFQLMIPLTQESRVLISIGLCSVAQSWPALCPALDCSPPDSSVYELFQARILKWVAISFSRGSSQPKDRTWVSCVSCIAGRCFTTLPPGKPRRDVRHTPYGCPPTPVTEGEGLSRAGSYSVCVYKKFNFTCYIKGDPRLHWANENGSNGIDSQAGTQAPSVGVRDQLIHKEVGLY